MHETTGAPVATPLCAAGVCGHCRTNRKLSTAFPRLLLLLQRQTLAMANQNRDLALCALELGALDLEMDPDLSANELCAADEGALAPGLLEL